MKKRLISALLLLFFALLVQGAYPQKVKENFSDDPPLNQMEKELFRMVNHERTKEGLKPLVYEEKAYRAALYHSEDMAKRDFFNHHSPEGHSVTNRLKQQNFEFSNTAWGENIASCYNYKNPLEITLTSWMKSPGHKKNILNSKYRYGAIGIARTPKGRYYFTQVFWGPLQ